MPQTTVDDRIVARSHLETEARIRRRAHEIWESHRRSGSELADWLQAEREVLGEGKQSAQNRATTVGHAGRPGKGLLRHLGEG